MTIREELKQQLQEAKANLAEKERDLEFQARVMIEKFLIPKFRDCAKAYPLDHCLVVEFHSNIGCWCYTSNIDKWESRKKTPYDYEVVSKAIQIAEKYDITAREVDDGANGTIFIFSLELDE